MTMLLSAMIILFLRKMKVVELIVVNAEIRVINQISKNLLDEIRSGKVNTLYNVKCRLVLFKGTPIINLIQ